MEIVGPYEVEQDFGIKEIEGPDHKKAISIEYYDGEYSESTKLVIPESLKGLPVTAIGDEAFAGVEELAEVILPESITSIGERAFMSCSNLTKINIPKNTASIDRWAFHGCTKLKKIILPKGVNDIGDDTFGGCHALTEITVNEQNTAYASVDGVLFDKNITTLVKYPESKKGAYAIPDTVIDMDNSSFRFHKNITRITFPEHFRQPLLFSMFFYCEKLTDIEVHEKNPFICSIDGVLFDKEGKNLLSYPPGRTNTAYTIPAGTTCICNAAFNSCEHLTEIFFPKRLMLIERMAFHGCTGLGSIILPKSLEYIGEYAFEFCPNIKTITLSRKTKVNYTAFKPFLGQFIYLD